MNRRSFIAALAAVPVVGRLIRSSKANEEVPLPLPQASSPSERVWIVRGNPEDVYFGPDSKPVYLDAATNTVSTTPNGTPPFGWMISTTTNPAD